jgi:hypothetical protein
LSIGSRTVLDINLSTTQSNSQFPVHNPGRRMGDDRRDHSAKRNDLELRLSPLL